MEHAECATCCCFIRKLLDGEIDPETAAEQIKISKSAWRKQKGEFSKKGASEAQRILDGELPDDLTGPEVSGRG